MNRLSKPVVNISQAKCAEQPHGAALAVNERDPMTRLRHTARWFLRRADGTVHDPLRNSVRPRFRISVFREQEVSLGEFYTNTEIADCTEMQSAIID